MTRVIEFIGCCANWLINALFPVEDEDDEDVPAWEGMRGVAPDATGRLSSEAFIRELRDDWPSPDETIEAIVRRTAT